LRRAQKSRKRLRGSLNMMRLVPEKPRGMYHDTYVRLFWEHREAEMEKLMVMRELLNKLQRHIN
jgi:hypothetical protein